MDIQRYYSRIREEEQRNNRFLHLTPNEPYMSDTARAFMGSKLADRYYMGGGEDEMVDLGPLTALGFPGIEALVIAAEDATKEMLGAAEVNLNCLSGVHAMMCAILSTTEPGDTVMTVHHDYGGHFATKGIVDRIGRKHLFTPNYHFDTLSFDAEAIAKAFKEAGAKAFYMDVSYYLNPHNLREIRAALGDKAIIIYDASHTMGLIMGQQFQAPLKEGANVICANTHKTLPGPQKGMIAFRDSELGEKANGIINACLYSSPHTVSMIALSTTILEMKEFGQEYAKQIIANSNALGEALAKRGHKLRKANTGRYSEDHQVHLFTEHLGDYRKLYRQFFANSITLAFDDPDILKQGMFIRLGTQEITRRGMKEAEMDTIAGFLDRSIKAERFAGEVESFNDKYRQAQYSFDTQVTVD
jgi:glycine/serine hydroxymethyltransferase